MKYTKHHEPISTAKALVAFLVLAIAFVLFYKFIKYQDFLKQDPTALQNYIIFTIVISGFLIGLMYLAGQTTHKAKAKSVSKSTTKSSKAKKKK